MTKEQIETRLKVLEDYEWSLLRNTWDDPDRVADEQLKVIKVRSKLKDMLNDAR